MPSPLLLFRLFHLSTSNLCISSLLSLTSSVVSTLGNGPGIPQMKAGVSITMLTEMKAPVPSLTSRSGSGVHRRRQRCSVAVAVNHCLWTPQIGGNLRTMIRVFRLFDYNREGHIQQHEFRRILDNYCLHLTDKEFQRWGLVTSDTVWHKRSDMNSVQQHAKAHTHHTWTGWLVSQLGFLTTFG